MLQCFSSNERNKQIEWTQGIESAIFLSESIWNNLTWKKFWTQYPGSSGNVWNSKCEKFPHNPISNPLVLSWYLHQPESHELSFNKVCQLQTEIGIQRPDAKAYLSPIKINWITYYTIYRFYKCIFRKCIFQICSLVGEHLQVAGLMLLGRSWRALGEFLHKTIFQFSGLVK